MGLPFFKVAGKEAQRSFAENTSTRWLTLAALGDILSKYTVFGTYKQRPNCFCCCDANGNVHIFATRVEHGMFRRWPRSAPPCLNQNYSSCIQGAGFREMALNPIPTRHHLGKLVASSSCASPFGSGVSWEIRRKTADSTVNQLQALGFSAQL